MQACTRTYDIADTAQCGLAEFLIKRAQLFLAFPAHIQPFTGFSKKTEGANSLCKVG